MSAGQRAKQSGLAGAVGADQRDGLALRHLQRNAPHRLQQAVAAVELDDLEKGAHDLRPPRYASITAACPTTSFGGPSAMTRPPSMATSRPTTRISTWTMCSIHSTARP